MVEESCSPYGSQEEKREGEGKDEEEGEREREKKPRTRYFFPGHVPVTYFLQLDPTSYFLPPPSNAVIS
jgi:hypothetical protein